MTTLREAAQQALDALEVATTPRSEDRQTVLKAQAALRKALAQPEPEPVAWMDRDGDIYPMPETEGWRPPHKLLYTHPPQRKPLTDEEILKAWKPYEGNAFTTKYEFARAIERAHGIGSQE